MRAIVANLLAGSFCLAMISPAWADVASQNQKPDILETDISTKIWSTNTFGNDTPWLFPIINNFEDQVLDYVLLLEEKNLNNIIHQDNWLQHQKPTPFSRENLDHELLSLRKNPYLYRHENQDLIIGLHNNFWSRENQQKYYGLTTIEQWGSAPTPKLRLKKLNYLDSAPILPKGTSALTLSGGGRKNLIQENYLLREFDDFRGGATFHQGLADDLTLGVGFVYEDLLFSGFSQVAYKPHNFPLQTTLSLINEKQGLSLYSHLQFQPVNSFIIDFYGKEAQQKFALNWKINSEFNLIATGTREQGELKTGGKFTFKNNLLSLFAKTEVNSNKKIQWQVSSKIGRLQLMYKASTFKTNSQIDYVLGNTNNQDWQSSLFVKNQTGRSDKSLKNLAILGWHFQSNSPFPWQTKDLQDHSSKKKINRNNYLWQFDLGYGMGSQGKGAIISASTLVRSGIYLKLSYTGISEVSDETKIQLKLISTQ